MGITTFSRNQRSWGGRSDFSRPSYGSSTTTTELEEPKVTIEPVEEISHITQPRFSVFGKKAKFESINQKSLEQDKKAEAMEPIRRKSSSNNNKFELHLSKTKKKKKSVAFDPIFLEKVCLFREEQSPCELKEAHDNTHNSRFRIICPNWPVITKNVNDKNILLDKKSFFVTDDNKSIKGKILIRNLALDKSVSVRYSLDGWTTVNDVDAVFFGPNPKNVAFDIYEFSIQLGHGQLADRGEIRGKIEFTIRFSAGEDDYWDNNQGSNYKIRVLCDPLNDPWAKEKELEKQQDDVEEENDDYSEAEEDEDIDEEQENQEKHSSFTNALKGYKHAKPFHLNKRQPWLGTRYDFGQSLQLAKRAPYESWSNSVKADPDLITDYFLVKPISIKPTTPPPPPPPPSPPKDNTPTPSSSTNTTTTITTKISPNIISFSSYPKLSTTTSTPTTTTTTTILNSPSSPPTTVPIYTASSSSSSAPPSPRTSPTLASALPPRPTFHNHSRSTSSILPIISSTASSPLDMNSTYYLDLVNKYCFYNSDSSIN